MKVMAQLMLILLATVISICNGSKKSCTLDLGFILDESGSIMKSGFNDEKQFVRDIARQFNISSTRTRVSVMTFSTNARMMVYFKDKSAQSYHSLDEALKKMPYNQGGTNTDRALNLAKSHMFSTSYGARKNVPKVLIFLSDGKSQSGVQKVAVAAEKLKKSGVNIFSIGVGKDIGTEELVAIASTPTSSHVVQVSSATTLSTVVHTVFSQSCKEDSCKYVECVMYSWGSWNKICGKNKARTRTLIQSWGIKKQIGGCAGLTTSTSCHKPKEQNATEGVCTDRSPRTEPAACGCGWKTVAGIVAITVGVLLLLILMSMLLFTYGMSYYRERNAAISEGQNKKNQGKESETLL